MTRQPHARPAWMVERDRRHQELAVVRDGILIAIALFVIVSASIVAWQ